MSVWVFENHQSILRHHVFSLYGLVIRVPRFTFSFSHFNQMIIIWYYIETLCCCQKWQLAQILKSPRILGCWNVTCGQILHSCKSLPVLGCILTVIGQILCDSKSLPVLGWMGDLANRRRRFSQDLVKISLSWWNTNPSVKSQTLSRHVDHFRHVRVYQQA